MVAGVDKLLQSYKEVVFRKARNGIWKIQINWEKLLDMDNDEVC
jgi:hypothetical protein